MTKCEGCGWDNPDICKICRHEEEADQNESDIRTGENL